MSGRLRITLEQHLEWLALQGHEVRAPTPPRYEQLWWWAREAGLHLGELYVLRASLAPHVGGSYHRESGDVVEKLRTWCLKAARTGRWRRRHHLKYPLCQVQQMKSS